jgi:hypothetical protein
MIKLNSWHYRLANFCEKRVWAGDEIDFCKYSRSVLAGLLWLMFAIVGSLFVIGATVDTIYELIMFFKHGTKMSEGAIVILILYASAIGGCLIGYGAVKYIDHRDKTLVNRINAKREPGFFALAYRKFKTKTCFKVVVEEKKKSR